MAKNKTFNLTSLATSDQKDMQRLSAQASKGWHLKKIKVPYFSYELHESEGKKRNYIVDYNKNKSDDYIREFKSKGWKYICSNNNLHYFRAPLNTPTHYTDVTGKKMLYRKISTNLLLALLVGVISNGLVFLGFNVFSQADEPISLLISVFFAVGLLLLVVNVLLLYGWFAYSRRTKNIESEKV